MAFFPPFWQLKNDIFPKFVRHGTEDFETANDSHLGRNLRVKV